MNISPISTFSSLPLQGIQPLPGTGAGVAAGAGAAKPDFGGMVASGLEKLQSVQSTSDNLAVVERAQDAYQRALELGK